MRLALVQMSNAGDIQSNLNKSMNTIYEAASNGAEMVLFPEVQLTEFFPQYKGRDVSVAIAMCNRVGVEDSMDFSGESLVVDADGNVLFKADDKEQIIYVDIDLGRSEIIRNSRPYTNLRRTETYR